MDERRAGYCALALSLLAIIVLPALSCLAAGKNFGRYFVFPPPVSSARFEVSEALFTSGVLISLFVGGALIFHFVRQWRPMPGFSIFRVPLWGLAGGALMCGAWYVCWQQPPNTGTLGRAAFFMLWFGFILTLNAAVLGFGGMPLLRRDFTRWLALFPASALLWWIFEWINRSVHNWSYPNSELLTALQFISFASLSFSTVLPALLALGELLSVPFSAAAAKQTRLPRTWIAAGLGGACTLLALDYFPQQLFPFVWVSPLLILIGFLAAFGNTQVSYLRLVHWSAVGLICGFFWEFWNYWSYYRWIYHVPYVSRFFIFEMPLAGYLGYLPFGAFCGLVIELLIASAKTSAEAGLIQKNSPEHVAIIMDGNGRWAKQRGLIRSAGHQRGIAALRSIVKAARSRNIKYLTVYVFSAQNWKRPQSEIRFLMACLEAYANRELPELLAGGVRVRAMGALENLPEAVQIALEKLEEATKQNTQLVFTLAVSYGGREELLAAMKGVGAAVAQGEIAAGQIDESCVRSYLYLPELPDPDLLIRTSGETRISNFMLWQLAYTEFVFSPVLWPDFNAAEFDRCLEEYRSRQRRFGGLSGVLTAG